VIGVRLLLPACLLLVLSLTLNIVGITWGQPNGVDWDFDSIAGVQSVKEPRYFPGEWRHKYPPLHFLMNAAIYKPLLSRWWSDPAEIPLSESKILADPELGRRFGALIVASRLLSAIMGAGAVLAILLAALRLTGDPLAALACGLSLALTQMFVFYSHTGNVDVPACFWFAWAVHAAAGIVTRTRWIDFALTGVFCALAVGTKDALVGFLPGLLAAVVVSLLPRAESWHAGRPRLWVSSFSVKSLAGVLAFGGVFSLVNDLWTGWEPFLVRLGHWVDGPGVSDFNQRFAGQGPLLLKSFLNVWVGLGWPLLAAGCVSLFYCAARAPRVAAFGALPCLSFYVLIIAKTGLSYPRFFLPAYVTLALITGTACAAWLRAGALPRLARRGLPAAVAALSLLYCLGVGLEMRDDTRYRVEDWFRLNVPEGARVAVLGPPAVSPRLQRLGYDVQWRFGRPTRARLLEAAPHPDWLILSEKYFTHAELFDPKFLDALLAGKAGYTVEAVFRKRWLPPAGGPFALAGSGQPWMDQVSPIIYVLKRSG